MKLITPDLTDCTVKGEVLIKYTGRPGLQNTNGEKTFLKNSTKIFSNSLNEETDYSYCVKQQRR